MTNAIQTFNAWSKKNRDEGMEKNHAFSVQKMIELIPSQISQKKFSFLDVGCGNGWVVREMHKIENCIKSVGIDGAENMINKAISCDSRSEYLKLDIETMSYNKKFDIVFSMEVFYYFKYPSKVLKYIYQNILIQIYLPL